MNAVLYGLRDFSERENSCRFVGVVESGWKEAWNIGVLYPIFPQHSNSLLFLLRSEYSDHKIQYMGKYEPEV